MKKITFLFTSLMFVLMVSSFAYATEQTEAYTGEDVIEYNASNVSHKMLGKAISPKKSPYVIAYYEDGEGWRHREDGILISKSHVLMGAHIMCEYLANLKRVYVKAGDEEINVVEYNTPETFKCDDDACRTDDVMILTLEKPVKLNKPLPIVNSAKNYKKGTPVQIAGFGRINDNDYFGTLRQSSTKIESKKGKNFFLLQQFRGTECYTSAEGSPAVTVKVKNKKGKMTKAIAGIVTCLPKNKRGYKQDQVMILQNKNTKNFIKKILGKEAKFM